jgi:hypothetical protein
MLVVPSGIVKFELYITPPPPPPPPMSIPPPPPPATSNASTLFIPIPPIAPSVKVVMVMLVVTAFTQPLASVTV